LIDFRAEASIHVDDILVGDIEVLHDQSNLVGMQVAAFDARSCSLPSAV